MSSIYQKLGLPVPIAGCSFIWYPRNHLGLLSRYRRSALDSTPQILPPSIVRAAIQEAHLNGLRVIGHLGQTSWQEAAEMGIDSLAHSWYAGLAHSIVPVRHRAEFRDFYIPNRRFNPGLFRKWREVVDPAGPEVRSLASITPRATSGQ